MRVLWMLVRQFVWALVFSVSAGAAIEHPHPPPNNHYTNAIVLTDVSGRIDGTLAGATLETGETTGPTVWYKWTAPQDMTLTFRYILREGVSMMADFFVGTNWADAFPVAVNGHIGAISNTTYYIRIACCC